MHATRPHAKKNLFEYRYLLVRAKDDKNASARALQLAKAKEHSYRNPAGVRVNWLLEVLAHSVYTCNLFGIKSFAGHHPLTPFFSHLSKKGGRGDPQR